MIFETLRVGGDRGRAAGGKGGAWLAAVALAVGLAGLVGASVLNGRDDHAAAVAATAVTDAGDATDAAESVTPVPSVGGVPAWVYRGPPYGRGTFDPGAADLVLLRVRPAGDVVHVHGDVQLPRTIHLVVWVDGDPAPSGDPPRDLLATSSAALTIRTTRSFDVALPLPAGIPYGEIFVEANTFDSAGDLLSRTRTRLSDATG